MEIKNYNSINPNLIKETAKNPVKNEDSLNISKENDSFVPQERGKEGLSFMGKLKEKFFSAISTPLYSRYPEVTEEKKQKILDSLQPGDIILETNANYPLWLFMEKVAGNSDYSHAAIYEGNDHMIEADSDAGVVRTDLKNYLKGRMAIKVIRPDYKSEEDIKATLDYARNQIGKPYDSSFDYSEDDKLYCSELVAKSLKAAPSNMTIVTQNIKILGGEAILPGDMQKLKNSTVVYDDKYSVPQGLKYMSPAVAGGVAFGMSGALLLGPVGAALGTVGGILATSFIGGKIQVGKIEGK